MHSLIRSCGLIYPGTGIWWWTEIYRIRKWKNTSLCFRCYPVLISTTTKTNSYGNWARMVLSQLNLFMITWLVTTDIPPWIFMPIWFGKPRLPLEYPFLLGKLLKNASLLLTISKEEELSWLIYVTSAKLIWKPPIICSYGVRFHNHFGLWFSALWDCIGLLMVWLKENYLLGKVFARKNHPTELFPYLFFGSFGKKKTEEPLQEKKWILSQSRTNDFTFLVLLF